MKRKFEIGQKLFFVEIKYRLGEEHTFESPITEIGRKYLKVQDLSHKINIETLEIIDTWVGLECFESKEAFELDEQRKELAKKLKHSIHFDKFTLDQLKQIESLIKLLEKT